MLLVFVALVGLGTSGTQTLIYGFVANYYPTNVRGAGVAWCAGFGRLGGIGGPLIGGFMIGAAMGVTQILLILAGVALVGPVVIGRSPVAALNRPVVEPSNSTAPASTSVAVFR